MAVKIHTVLFSAVTPRSLWVGTNGSTERTVSIFRVLCRLFYWLNYCPYVFGA
jgi:hypothetical protein